jgi:hypothetical protein
VLAPNTDMLFTMQLFNEALGVQCTYCHVQGDMASDSNAKKDIARKDDRDRAADRRQLPQQYRRVPRRLPRSGLHDLPPRQRQAGDRAAQGVLQPQRSAGRAAAADYARRESEGAAARHTGPWRGASCTSSATHFASTARSAMAAAGRSRRRRIHGRTSPAT